MKIEKTEYGYQVTECDIKFGEQITLDGELLIPISDIEDIKVEMEKLPTYSLELERPNSKVWRDVVEYHKVVNIIDKYINGN